jgi:EmrB/QacA subfamily drug resistance transporter
MTLDPRRWRALALLAVANFMVILDASIMNVASPSIGEHLHISTSTLPWVVNAYVLAFGGLLLLGGRLADLLGRRRVFLVATALFSAASLAGGLAQTAGQLLAFRAVQGVGAALLAPSALALVATTFTDPTERNKAIGIWGAVAGSGAAAGVLLGGVLTEALGWRAVLFVNVPIGVATILLAPRLVHESRAGGMTRSFDLLGAFTVTAGLASLVYALIGTDRHGWTSPETLGLFGVALVLLAAFVVIERRAASPLLPFGIFRNRAVTGANAVGLLVGGAITSLFFFLSLYQQQVLHYSALKSGLSQLPLAAAIILAAVAASKLVTRVGAKAVMTAGLALFAVGLLWLAQAPADGSYVADQLGPFLIIALAVGLAFVPMTIASVHNVPEQESGLASGLINTSQQIGGAIGLALTATIANSHIDKTLATANGRPAVILDALAGGFDRAFLAGAVLAAVAMVAGLMILRGRIADAAAPAPAV